MDYLSVKEIAPKWGLSPRSIRNYCAQGRVPGAKLKGKKWLLPADASIPLRSNAHVSSLLGRLQEEQGRAIKNGIYHYVQVAFAYNSNHIEGSQLSPEQTQMIFSTSTLTANGVSINIDDIVETRNHFRAVDYVLQHVNTPLSERFIKGLHALLKAGTSDAAQDWFQVGDYKRFPNVVGERKTTQPAQVAQKMSSLLFDYRKKNTKTLHDLLEFHVKFERIHPFQDGNGRVGRLILFKECLRYKVTPFIIEDDMKWFYYRGLNEWDKEPGYLLGTTQTAQDRFKEQLTYFHIREK